MGKHIGEGMIFDTSEKGLLTLFKPYQAALMEHLWKLNEGERVGMTSGHGYEILKDNLDSKSRAAIIFFLNDMVQEGILTYEEETGKGGYHRVYYPKMNKELFTQYVIETITKKLGEVFPSI